MTIPHDAGNRRRPSRRGSDQRASVRVGVISVVMLLLTLAGLAVGFIEPIRDATAASHTGDIVSEEDVEELAKELLVVRGRGDFLAAIFDRRISLDITIYSGFDRNWVVPPRPDGRAPSLRLVSKLCPNSVDTPTYLRMFFYGENFGADDFGLNGDKAILRGVYRVGPLTETEIGPGGIPSCHFDLTLVG